MNVVDCVSDKTVILASTVAAGSLLIILLVVIVIISWRRYVLFFLYVPIIILRVSCSMMGYFPYTTMVTFMAEGNRVKPTVNCGPSSGI